METLPPLTRLALAYAPSAVRPVWLGALALDARLAQVVRDAREPLIGRIRLAWWRERLAEDASAWPVGEPLLALLSGWNGGHHSLRAAVDGWEELLGEGPLSRESLFAAAEGRAAGLVVAANRLGHGDHADTVHRLARRWAIADMAAHLSDPREREILAELAAAEDVAAEPLPRALRPIVVLQGMAGETRSGMAAILRALRLGILGR